MPISNRWNRRTPARKSDRERREAEKIAESKRQQAKAEEENVANSEKTAKYFRGVAANALKQKPAQNKQTLAVFLVQRGLTSG